jgi:uncharacterized protein YggE
MDNQCILSIAGQGRLETDADTLEMEFKISRRGETTAIAQKKTNVAVNKLLKELNNLGINNENIKISSISMHGYWDDYNSKDRKIIQQVDQEVTCFIYDIKLCVDKIKNIIDFIASFDEKVAYTQTFHLKNVSDVIKKCKEIAFNDAMKNAEEYAKIANHKIKSIIKISEFEPSERTNVFPICAGSPDEETSITNFSIEKIETVITLYLDFVIERIFD